MKGSLKGSFASVWDCFVVLIVASGLLAMTMGVWGCESGGDGNGGGNTGSNASNQTACDNYCNLCESDRMGDCMEDCLGDEDAPNLTQECLECTANATECGEINNGCWGVCKWNENEKTICNNYCQLCDSSDGDPDDPEIESMQKNCMGGCYENIKDDDNPQACQECLINTRECGNEESNCGPICDPDEYL